MAQIRLTKTDEIEKILGYLRQKWVAMDEVEILKMAISKFYQDELADDLPVEFLSKEDSKGIQTSRKQIQQGKTSQYNSQDFLKHINED